MSRSQQIAVRLSAALLVVAAAIGVAVFTHLPTFFNAEASCNGCSGAFYGVDETKIVAAIQNIWPQGNTNNCGVETAEAVVNYVDQVVGVPPRFTSTQDMFQINQALQGSQAASQWGYATPVQQWAGLSNIAPDAGTDPRSIAYITQTYLPANSVLRFHDYIYRWSFFHSSEPSLSTQDLEATTSLAESIERTGLPVNTTINGGAHSVVVTGVWSGNDPNTNYPAQIRGLVFRDPEYAASSSRFEVDFATWSSTGLYMPPNSYYYSLWSLYYGDLRTLNDHQNTADPEPTVGPYVPNAALGEPYHWFHGQTWIQSDTFVSPSFTRIGPGIPTPATRSPALILNVPQTNVDWAYVASSPWSPGFLLRSP